MSATIKSDFYQTFENLYHLGADQLDYKPRGYTARNVSESGTVTYTGFARPGTPNNEDSWFILRVDTSSENRIRMSQSGSWDNRATLNYI